MECTIFVSAAAVVTLIKRELPEHKANVDRVLSLERVFDALKIAGVDEDKTLPLPHSGEVNYAVKSKARRDRRRANRDTQVGRRRRR